MGLPDDNNSVYSESAAALIGPSRSRDQPPVGARVPIVSVEMHIDFISTNIVAMDNLVEKQRCLDTMERDMQHIPAVVSLAWAFKIPRRKVAAFERVSNMLRDHIQYLPDEHFSRLVETVDNMRPSLRELQKSQDGLLNYLVTYSAFKASQGGPDERQTRSDLHKSYMALLTLIGKMLHPKHRQV